MPYNAWVQICPLDQPISNSAFNDCSVTVIYSGVIITDVLLLRDGPSAPPPSPSSFCADVIVFFRDYSGLFLLWCFAFFLVFLWLSKCTFASVAWLPGRESRRLLTQRGSWSLAWETVAYSPPPPAPDQSRRSLFDLVKHLHVPSACFHFAFESLCHLPFTTRCAYVCEWVSEWVSEYACVQPVHVYSVCTCVFSYPCWYKLVTAPAWTSLGVSAFFYF